MVSIQCGLLKIHLDLVFYIFIILLLYIYIYILPLNTYFILQSMTLSLQFISQRFTFVVYFLIIDISNDISDGQCNSFQLFFNSGRLVM